MGANFFETKAKGKTANDAFKKAREEALYESGHGGYSGTIAEKSNFKMIPYLEGDRILFPDVGNFISAIMDKNYADFADKWGPACCIDLGDGEYIFFGYASS